VPSFQQWAHAYFGGGGGGGGGVWRNASKVPGLSHLVGRFAIG